MESTVGSEPGFGSYSLFQSIGSEPRHLWSHLRTQSIHSSNCDKSDDNLDQMFVFGYSCKLFRDDRRAQEIDCGQHLIGWNGSSDHLIDRFDVRGYLNDLSQYEAKHKNHLQELSEEELEIERLCEEERYADLMDDDLADDQEEEIKRLHMALADGTTYNQTNYNYDQNVEPTQPLPQPTITEQTSKPEDPDDFKLPSGLTPPEGMKLPESQKLHNIIEKTASFVSQHGMQMEIVLKTKQSSNKNFDFLSFDSLLYAYYKYILENIKNGKYIPKQSENSDNSNSDDSDDDHYLHPSLLGSAKARESQTFKIPSLLRAANTDDSYSQLVKSFKDRFPVTEEAVPEVKTKPVLEQPFKPLEAEFKNTFNTKEKNSFSTQSQNIVNSLLPSPPLEIEQIIEKLAERVANSGETFEQSIRKLDEKRFEFVNPGHIYHAHYIRRKLHFLEQNRRAQAASAQLKISNRKYSKADSKALKAPVSFSITIKESKPTAQIAPTDENLLNTVLSKREEERNINQEINAKRKSDNALKDKLALAVRDRAAKDKQEERKRKAAMFLSLIKSKSKQIKCDSNENVNQMANTFGPEMQKPKPTSNSAPLSPTTVAVTSPTSSPIRNECLSHKNYDSAKSGSLLPFIVSDKPLKESSSRQSPHRHHKSRHSSSHKKSHKKKRSRTPKSRSRSHTPLRSQRKHSKHSKSRSRSRSRSHSRSHKKH